MTTSHGAARKDGPPREPREQYQHRTAGLLRELGFAAEMNDPLPAANGVVHKVGVSARIAVAGVNVLWIAECKLWNWVVPKEKVSALEDIVNDLGADRGLLMSERDSSPERALVAVGNSILTIAWHLLSDPGACYTDLGPDWHDHLAPQRRKRQFITELERLSGMKVTVQEDAA
jgi:hypothetical protein